VLIVPWVLYGLLTTFLGLTGILDVLMRNHKGREELWLIWIWVGVALLCDLVLYVAARERLLTQFRAVAARRTRKRFPFLPSFSRRKGL